MKSDWIIVLSCIGLIAASFAIAFLGGAYAAHQDALVLEQARLVDAR